MSTNPPSALPPMGAAPAQMTGLPPKRICLWLDPTPREGYHNMAADELLARRPEAWLRIYGWDRPSVSFGYFDTVGVAASIFPGDDIAYIRRWTGGGIVDHRKGYTYTVTLPAQPGVMYPTSADLYKWIHGALADALVGSGVSCRLLVEDAPDGGRACWASPVASDIVNDSGQKLAGAGQRRYKGAVLHQGLIQECEPSPGWEKLLAQGLAAEVDVITAEEPYAGFAAELEELCRSKYQSESWNDESHGRRKPTDLVAPEPPAAFPPDSWRENVAAIVMDAAGRVLLGMGTGRNAYWHFPQGGVGSKETLEDALRRELREEAGLEPTAYQLQASYGGLRYRYRKSNDKHARWRGQQQTYFLVLCHGEQPATDCSQTEEFSALTWLPWQELRPELFAPFKRKVVEKVLAHFFPPAAAPAPLAYARTRLTMQRYRCFAAPDIEVDETTLFAGGKDEAALQLERLSLRLRAAQKGLAACGGRLLVLVMGTEGSGRRQTLRRLATALDPLLLHACREGDAFNAPQHMPWPLLEQLPPPGFTSLFLHNKASAAMPQGWQALESWLEGQGVTLLKLSLYGDAVSGRDFALQATTNTESSPWYAAPAGRRWYRDLVVFTLVAEALESALAAPPLMH